MTIGCNIWMICLKLNWFFYSLSRMLQFSQFVWTPCYSVWDAFNNFLLIDATDRSKISGDQKRFFIALRLYPLSFFANTPFNMHIKIIKREYIPLSNHQIECLIHKGTLNLYLSSNEEDIVVFLSKMLKFIKELSLCSFNS